MGYYKDQLPLLIKSAKNAIAECYKIIDSEIDVSFTDEDSNAKGYKKTAMLLTEDKMHAVLKGKRMAFEDVKFYAKEIEILEDEMNGTQKEDEEVSDPNKKHVRTK